MWDAAHSTSLREGGARRTNLVAAALLCVAGVVPAAQNEERLAEPGGLVSRPAPVVQPATMGEDGIPYPRSRPTELSDPIHPDLREAALSGEPVEVFLLLRIQAGAGGPDPAFVKAGHMVRIHEISEEIRGIERRYRPEGPLTREKERGIPIESFISDDDRARRRDLQEESDRRLDAMRRAAAGTLLHQVRGAQEAIARQVERLGGEARARIVTGNVLDAIVPGHALIELAEHPLVAALVPRHERTPALDKSSTTAGFPIWYTNGLDGGVYDIGIADTGVQQNHRAFTGKVFFSNTGTTTDPDGHGTHVAGIVGSGDATYRGAAYGLDAIIWGLAGGNAFVTMDWAVTSAGQQLEVFNMSWQYGLATDVDYNYENRWFDVFVGYYDVLISFAAGNSGWSDATTTMSHPAVGYNAITVAKTRRRRRARSGGASTTA